MFKRCLTGTFCHESMVSLAPFFKSTLSQGHLPSCDMHAHMHACNHAIFSHFWKLLSPFCQQNLDRPHLTSWGQMFDESMGWHPVWPALATAGPNRCIALWQQGILHSACSAFLCRTQELSATLGHVVKFSTTGIAKWEMLRAGAGLNWNARLCLFENSHNLCLFSKSVHKQKKPMNMNLFNWH